MMKIKHSIASLKINSQAVKSQREEKSFQLKNRIRRQYNPNDTNIAKLFLAIREHKIGDIELDKTNAIKKLLVQIQNINDIDLNDDGNTPLHVTVSKEHQDIVELLLNTSGIGVNIQNNQGDTSLHIAVSKDNEELVRLLLSKKAEVNIENEGKKTGSVASINCGTRRSLNWDYGSYRAISIAKFSKVETLSLAPIICLF